MLTALIRKFIHRLFSREGYKVDASKVNRVGAGNALERDAWVIQALQQLPAGIRILDAGAGEQPYKKYCKHLNYVSQDFAQYNPTALSEGLQMTAWDYGQLDIVSDIVAIPRPDASFDAILCTEVIEHILRPLEALREFHRLLRPGGQLILTAPFCSMTHFAPYHFYSGFNRFFYESALSDLGFEMLEMSENGNYFEFLAQELKRLPEVGNTYAHLELPDHVNHALQVVLEHLSDCSAHDKGSKELLFFGMHLKAVKK